MKNIFGHNFEDYSGFRLTNFIYYKCTDCKLVVFISTAPGTAGELKISCIDNSKYEDMLHQNMLLKENSTFHCNNLLIKLIIE